MHGAGHPVFNWAVKAFPRFDIIGSALLGDSVSPGEIVDGVRNENLQNLSFKDASIGLVVSNDVLAYVTSPRMVFTQLARVMRRAPML